MRYALGLLSLVGLGAISRQLSQFGKNKINQNENGEGASAMANSNSSSLVRRSFPLSFQWPTFEPFLFCVHHLDHYPQGNGSYGPVDFSWSGRERGSDFMEKDGYRMYHGESVPGFPVHPHRGFETITIVRKGYVDHADSMGAAGRYGEGDVQWMTAGRGVQHCEMFPLLKTEEKNTVELFQIWLNLPRKNKMVEPHFSMFWSEKIPQLNLDQGRVRMNLIFGNYGDMQSMSAPPHSWASFSESETQIYLVKIADQGIFEMPPSKSETNRVIYVFSGEKFKLNGEVLAPGQGYWLDSQRAMNVTALGQNFEMLVLQSRPIGEPVVQHGPFVMNSKQEIIQAFEDYQKDHFGGWSWNRQDMVHGEKIERFAKFPNGKIEKPS